MKLRPPLLVLAFLPWLITATLQSGETMAYRRLPLSEYRNKMKAGWIGQMVGVAWGGPTEFKWQDQIIPADKMPTWRPEMINDAFGQDDLYVEMTFLRTLEQYGLDVSIRQAGIDFANTRYPLWCANNAGRTNLRKGIAPPDSSHPKFNRCPNDIDYQIEADYSGLIAPGIPQAAVDLGEKFGRLMNYGDGMYAGQFVGAMYAAAFFETRPTKIIETALLAIPAESQYAEMVRDVLAWYKANPNDWQKCWEKCQEKYRRNPEYQKASNGGIDCKINGAYVLLGLLYGNADPEQTILISCRSGMDSDCNPSTAAGVLFTSIGFTDLPERFKSSLNQSQKFTHTDYTFPELLAVCEKLARQVVTRYGGYIEKHPGGDEVFVIPVHRPKPSVLELSWEPGPIANSRFTSEEMALIVMANTPPKVREEFAKFAPGWQIDNCGPDMNPGLRTEWQGRKNVFVSHPLDQQTGCVISRTIDVPANRKTRLRVLVGHDPQGDFDLVVRVAGQEMLRTAVSARTAKDEPWLPLTVDLTPYVGKTVKVELINEPTGWAYEAAYWAEIALESD